jgi:hypothetical protein
MSPIIAKLEGGDRRSIGRVDEVIADVLEDPALFDELFMGMLADDEVVRMRSADAVEKITLDHLEWLRPYKEVLLNQIAMIEQQEVRWHWAQMIPRLDLTEPERQQAVDILIGYLDDKSNIVKTFTMQALVDLAKIDPELYPQVKPIIEEATKSGSPAMKSRGRKLLMELDAIDLKGDRVTN